MVFDVFNLYLSEKTGQRYNSLLAKETVKYNSKMLKQKLDNSKTSINYFYRVDQKLLNKSIAQLIEMLNPQDFSNYVRVTQLTFLPNQNFINQKKNRKHLKRKIKLFNLGQQDKFTEQGLSVEVWLIEVDDILMGKRKRSDELIKFAYKGLRKRIFKKFKNELPKEDRIIKRNKRGPSLLKLQKRQFREFLFDMDEEMGNIFWDEHMTKKKIGCLRENKTFMRLINQYSKNKLVLESVEENIWLKSEVCLQKGVSLEKFMKSMLTKEKKNGWIIQNILNAVEELFYCLPENIRKMKRIKTE